LGHLGVDTHRKVRLLSYQSFRRQTSPRHDPLAKRGIEGQGRRLDEELGTPRDLIKRYKAGKVTWREFTAEYKRSLKGKEELLKGIARESKRGTITLLCVEKDSARCHRSILKEQIEKYL